MQEDDERNRHARRGVVSARPVRSDRLELRFPSLSFRVDLTGHCAEGGGSEVTDAGYAQLGREDPEVAGATRQEAGQSAIRRRRMGPLRRCAR
jgi:hypothetical protein